MESLLTLLGLAKDTISWIKKFVQPKIRTTPKIIELDRKDWGSEAYFTICNKTEEPLYDIQILLWHRVSDELEPTFPLTIKNIEDQEKGPETRIGPIVVNTSALIIDGTVKNNKVKLLQLGYLGPKKCIRVFYASIPQQKGNILVQPMNVSSSPPQTLRKANSLAISFKPPRDIKLSSMSLFMKRKS